MTNCHFDQGFDPPRTPAIYAVSSRLTAITRISMDQDCECQGCGAQFHEPAYADDYLRNYYSEYVIESRIGKKPELYCQ